MAKLESHIGIQLAGLGRLPARPKLEKTTAARRGLPGSEKMVLERLFYDLVRNRWSDMSSMSYRRRPIEGIRCSGHQRSQGVVG